MNKRRTAGETAESHSPSVTESEKEKVTTLWEKTKPFGECKESLKRYIAKRVEIQVQFFFHACNVINLLRSKSTLQYFTMINASQFYSLKE